MKIFYYLLIIEIFSIKYSHTKIYSNCRFSRKFYQKYSNIFELNQNQTYLTIHPLYSLTNQSRLSLSIGIIYYLSDTYLVPVPLVFQCLETKQIYSPIDCEFIILDNYINIQKSESTRIKTVQLNSLIRGAYFKQSKILLKNCRLNNKENNFISNIFYLNIKFEQKINSSCQKTCLHPELYQCSSISNTCQCHLGIENYKQFCIDTELKTNCSLTPQRCRNICRNTDKIDYYCQCPLGTQRILSNNKFHCEYNQKQYILSILLFIAGIIIIILIISLMKMRSIKSIKFIHLDKSSTCSTLSFSSNYIDGKYTKINLYE